MHSEHAVPTLHRPEAADPVFAASQVEALFSDLRSYAIGAGGVCFAASVVAYRTGSLNIVIVAALLTIIVAIRLVSMTSYKSRAMPRDDARLQARWQRVYNVGAACQMLAISVFCLTVFMTTREPLDRMIGMATVLAYMAGIPGRNFANPFGVNSQIVCGAIPLLVAMAVAGKDYWILTCILFLPYFVALKALANRLRGIFIEATVKTQDLTSLAARFDTALNNMPHGLAMLDRRGRVIVFNARLGELLQLDASRSIHGAPISALLDHVASGQDAHDRLHVAIDDSQADPIEISMGDGTLLEFSFQPMANGGAVALVQDVTERTRAAARIKQLALFDELTTLNNRSHFRTLLAERLEDNVDDVKQALMFIDLDQFKQVNDTLGHAYGDNLIRQVAARLTASAPDAVIARFGGDEFVVLYSIQDSLGEVEFIAGDLIAHISKPYRVDGHDVVIGASIGIAIFPDDDTSPDELMKKADLALYRAKAEGRGCYRVFQVSMGVAALARSELEMDLRQALKNDEFELHYQPIFNLEEQRFATCEALLRWRHPQRGLVSPMEFIPIAEDMGLIVEIGRWVLNKACVECQTWPSSVRVAVNISPLQFRRGDIVSSVVEALAASGLHPSRLELELTESVLLQDVAYTSVTMKLLHMQQVTISLDDFGTGYSSLSYMNELPLSKVKIDRSFLVGLETNERSLLMLKGLTRLSAELGLSTVIEGVETEAQLRLIQAATNVQEVQGYLFSRPLPVEGIRKLLHAQPTSEHSQQRSVA